MLYFEKVVLLN